MFAAMRMGKAVPPLMSDDEEIRHVQYAHETLQRRGGYIVANCLQLLRDLSCGDVHYTSLWNGAELKGLGLSSHSCCDGVLHQNTAELPEYYKMIDEGRLPVKRAHRMSGRDRISQVMVYGLKNLAVNCSAFVEKFGVDAVMIYRDLVERLTGEGVLVLDGEWLRLAPEYYIFADDVSRLFFLPEYEDMMLAHIERGRADSLVEAAVS
jgi:oxygen-independent coproporphyrinogen-3 oxidase